MIVIWQKRARGSGVSGPGSPEMLAAQPKYSPGQPDSSQPHPTWWEEHPPICTDYSWATFISISLYFCTFYRPRHFARGAPAANQFSLLYLCRCAVFYYRSWRLIFLFVSPASAMWSKNCLLPIRCLFTRVFCSAIRHLLASSEKTNIPLAVGLWEELVMGAETSLGPRSRGDSDGGSPAGPKGKGCV